MQKALDHLVRSFDPAMVVVTTAAEDDGERAGCLVGFHSQSSIGPWRYSFWLSKANHTYRVATRAPAFAIHFLTVRDLDVAVRFGTQTGDEVDKFADIEVSMDHGVPVLGACGNHVMVRKVAVLDEGGDHVGVTTEPISAAVAGRFQPLRLSDVIHLTPGHEADEDVG